MNTIRCRAPRAYRHLATSCPVHNNKRPDFKTIVEASRAPWDSASPFRVTKTAHPEWNFAEGPNHLDSKVKSRTHVSIDPYEHDRPPGFNYRLLTSAVAPRPIALISTINKAGSMHNLAPFSYFNMVCHDPPLLMVSFSPGEGQSNKDTLRNILETEECVINIISESFVEAANSTSVNAPYGVSEWDVSGLTPVYETETVKAPRLGEAVFSIEAKLHSVQEFTSKLVAGQKSATMVVFEGTRFWVGEDALNEQRNQVDPAVLRPVSRMGGITYGRVTQGFELPRPNFETVKAAMSSKKTD